MPALDLSISDIGVLNDAFMDFAGRRLQGDKRLEKSERFLRRLIDRKSRPGFRREGPKRVLYEAFPRDREKLLFV